VRGEEQEEAEGAGMEDEDDEEEEEEEEGEGMEEEEPQSACGWGEGGAFVTPGVCNSGLVPPAPPQKNMEAMGESVYMRVC
jgi:hypothetical protein